MLLEELIEPGSASSGARQAKARQAEWVNVRYLREPCAVGPPAKDRPRARAGDARTSVGRASCKKLPPRKLAAPGEEGVAEDPGRRDFRGPRLARNCHFLNHFIPIVAMLSDVFSGLV